MTRRILPYEGLEKFTEFLFRENLQVCWNRWAFQARHIKPKKVFCSKFFTHPLQLPFANSHRVQRLKLCCPQSTLPFFCRRSVSVLTRVSIIAFTASNIFFSVPERHLFIFRMFTYIIYFYEKFSFWLCVICLQAWHILFDFGFVIRIQFIKLFGLALNFRVIIFSWGITPIGIIFRLFSVSLCSESRSESMLLNKSSSCFCALSRAVESRISYVSWYSLSPTKNPAIQPPSPLRSFVLVTVRVLIFFPTSAAVNFISRL